MRGKIAGGDWSDDTQQAVDALVKRYAEDFGYDLDEEGQPLTDEAAPEVRPTHAEPASANGAPEAAEQEPAAV